MARFALSNEHEHGAVVWILTLLALIYTTLTLCLRLWVKLRMLGLDDSVAIVAQLLAFGSMGSVMYALEKGIAEDAPDRPESVAASLAQAFEANQILHLLTLSAAKVAMGLFLRRIFERADQQRVLVLCNVLVAAGALWGVGATIIVSVGCDSKATWLSGQGIWCLGAGTRWLIVALTDCTGEIILVMLAAYLVSGLHIRFGEKAAVCSAFAWRLGLVALSLLHYRFCNSLSRSQNLPGALARVLICEQVAICYSLMSITWPFSKQWIRSFDTSALSTTSMHDSNERTTTQKSNGMSGSRKWPSLQNRAPRSSAVYPISRAEGESGSQEMIIRRDDEVEVTFEERGPSSRTLE